jgi:serine/threonine protein kinase
MSPERFRRIEEAFHAAADTPTGERSAVLDRLCDGDAALRAEVEALLDAAPGAPHQIQAVIGHEAAVMTEVPRLVARRFEIERRAGSGGMGDVYRARDRHTGAAVALKLTRGDAGGPDADERFAREARLLAEIDHPGVVSYVAHGLIPDGRRYLAMEWLDGEDLAARLARGPLALAEAVPLLQRVAEALQVAHARAVVHRDLKPSNLFLLGGDVARPKLLDFGIARRTKSSHAMTRTGALVGTPDYMAPEQVRGERDITPAADVFSLGCVLYECLTGQPPFVAGHVAAVLARILFEDPLPLGECRPGMPAPVSALLGRMLAKDAAQRLAGAGALRAELEALGGLLEDSSAPTLSIRPRPSSVFAAREQGLFSLVMASPPPTADPDATVTAEEDRAEAERRSDVRSALEAMGLSADFMADGSLVVKMTTAGSAIDQAAHAARAALVVKERWTAANVALATGRGALEGSITVGEVADRAVRLLNAPEPSARETRSGVRVDELSARLLGPRFALTPSPEGVLLIGQEKDADVSRPLLGKPTPCVGREAELGALEALLAGSVEASEARAVLVPAPPGAGKSRLRHELLRRIERRGEPVTILAGRGDAMSAGAPYGILAAAIRALARVGSDVALEQQRRLLGARVGRHVAEAERERVVRFVGELCDVPFPDEGMPMLKAARHDPTIMGHCLRRAVLDWLAAECAAGPVLVVLDDLQWGDALMVSALDDALREQAEAPLFVLALARPEVHDAFPRLWHDHKVQEIALRGLGRKACERLIREVLGKDVSGAMVDRAIEQSAGNALFLEEMIRAIAEGKGEEQPETVVAMLQARMGRLSAGPRRALQAASVFGQTFWDGGVVRVLGLPAGSAEIMGWLSALIEAEMIQPSSVSRLQGKKEHAFRHALVRDAAYGLLTESDVATGHRLAGEFLEAAGEHDAAVVAEHFERGGDREKAAGFYLRAAEESLSRMDFAGALRLVDRGLGCAPEGEVLGRLNSVAAYADLYLLYLDAARRRAEAGRLAMSLLRPGSLGWCRAFVGAFWSEVDDHARFELASLLGSTVPEPDARVAYVDAQAHVFPLLLRASPERELQAYLDRVASSVDQASETIPAVRRYFLLVRGVVTVWRDPRPWSAVMDLGECIRLAHEVGDRHYELAARLIGMEVGWLELGDLDGARRRMLALAEKFSPGDKGLLFTYWARSLAWILCEVPEEQAWSQAEALLALLVPEGSGSTSFISLSALGILARVALLRGQAERAEELARTALRQWPLTFRPPAASVQIRALLGLGRTADAAAVAEHTLGALGELGGTGITEVEIRLATVEAFEAVGAHERARAELAESLRQVELRLDDIADPFWKNSYLTRNRYVARALALGREWGVPVPAPADP